MSGIAYGLVGDGVKQAFLEAETSVNTYAPPDLIKHLPGVCKAWAHITQTGTQSLDGKYNLDGIVDIAVGVTSIEFTTHFSAATYSQVTSAGSDYLYAHHLASNGTRVNDTGLRVRHTDGTYTDAAELCWAAFGDQ